MFVKYHYVFSYFGEPQKYYLYFQNVHNLQFGSHCF
jgi:hypothetical protein